MPRSIRLLHGRRWASYFDASELNAIMSWLTASISSCWHGNKHSHRRQDEADDVAAFSGVMAEKESAARSAADYAARKQREVDEAEKADLPAGVSISDMTNGVHAAPTSTHGFAGRLADTSCDLQSHVHGWCHSTLWRSRHRAWVSDNATFDPTQLTRMPRILSYGVTCMILPALAVRLRAVDVPCLQRHRGRPTNRRPHSRRWRRRSRS